MWGAFLRYSYWYPGFILSISPSSGVKERNDYTEKELSQLFFKRRNFTRVSLPNWASSLLPLPKGPGSRTGRVCPALLRDPAGLCVGFQGQREGTGLLETGSVVEGIVLSPEWLSCLTY